ncbi:MAG: DUF6304 family protein [Bacteroidia bacterium]
MEERIPATYIDKYGAVETEILNDGVLLQTEINGTRFTGYNFNDFKIENANQKPSRFSLNDRNELTACELIYNLPLVLKYMDEDFQTVLNISLIFDSSETKSYNDTNAVFRVKVHDREIVANNVDLFEPGLESIKNNLPKEYKLKCCYGCAFSDYSVYGQAFFGTMLCFKNIKMEYLKVNNKGEFMDIMDKRDAIVQETYLCNEFQEREKGTGYRG